MRGPESSGLVVGNADLIEAARMNGSPASSVGRGMKVGKEDLMGPLAAVELFLDGSDEDDYGRWRADAELIVAGLEGIEHVHATVDDGDQLFSPEACRASASSWASARPTPTAPRSATASPASSWAAGTAACSPTHDPAARRSPTGPRCLARF